MITLVLFLIYCAVHLHHLSASSEKNFHFCTDISRKLPLTRYSCFSVDRHELCYCNWFFCLVTWCTILLIEKHHLKINRFCSPFIQVGFISIALSILIYLHAHRFVGRTWFIGCGLFSLKVGDHGDVMNWIWVLALLRLVFSTQGLLMLLIHYVAQTQLFRRQNIYLIVYSWNNIHQCLKKKRKRKKRGKRERKETNKIEVPCCALIVLSRATWLLCLSS